MRRLRRFRRRGMARQGEIAKRQADLAWILLQHHREDEQDLLIIGALEIRELHDGDGHPLGTDRDCGSSPMTIASRTRCTTVSEAPLRRVEDALKVATELPMMCRENMPGRPEAA